MNAPANLAVFIHSKPELLAAVEGVDFEQGAQIIAIINGETRTRWNITPQATLPNTVRANRANQHPAVYRQMRPDERRKRLLTAVRKLKKNGLQKLATDRGHGWPLVRHDAVQRIHVLPDSSGE